MIFAAGSPRGGAEPAVRWGGWHPSSPFLWKLAFERRAEREVVFMIQVVCASIVRLFLLSASGI